MNHFAGKADVYAKARPDYAPAALDYICGMLPENAVIADIGAGTGIFTRQLAAQGYNLIAVEPNAEMRGKIPAGIHSIDGTAEATGLNDRSVDAITCATAFHWFDPVVFKTECKRILKPGGHMFLLFNRLELEEDFGTPELQWHDSTDQTAKFKRYTAALEDFIGNDQPKRFANPKEYDRAGHLAFMLSHSSSPKQGDEIYKRFAESVDAIFNRLSENDKIILTFETYIYSA